MKKVFSLFILLFLLIGCYPSEEELNAQIEEQVSIQLNQMVAETLTAIPTITNTPSPMPTITPTVVITEIPHMPDHEPFVFYDEKINNYVIELGYCPSSVLSIKGNPKDILGCVVEEEVEIYIDEGMEIALGVLFTPENPVQVFCSLYQLDRTYIMSNIISTSGLLVCRP